MGFEKLFNNICHKYIACIYEFPPQGQQHYLGKSANAYILRDLLKSCAKKSQRAIGNKYKYLIKTICFSSFTLQPGNLSFFSSELKKNLSQSFFFYIRLFSMPMFFKSILISIHSIHTYTTYKYFNLWHI